MLRVHSLYIIFILEKNINIPTKNGIPWKLTWNAQGKHLDYQLATDARAYSEMMEYDLERGQNSGMHEFGSNNIEGRIAWSQIYYLNGLMDVLYLAKHDDKAFNVFAPLLSKIRLRLELEIRLLDQMLAKPAGLRTKAFTFDRSTGLFAVQTSRVLLLLNRYQKEFPDAPPLANLNLLRRQVSKLEGHMEVLSNSGENQYWLARGQRHLRWPRGNAFYFDGLAVPYNHQNEWAYSIFDSSRNLGLSINSATLEPQREIIRHFLRHLATHGEFPTSTNWNYWWGHAYDGFNKSSLQSLHTTEYTGDKSIAWISFRTIDLMSILSSLDFIPEIDSVKLLRSATNRIEAGVVYPFAARSLIDRGLKPQLNTLIAHLYARSNAPWEFSNQPWALTALSATPESEDPHSIYLNNKVLNRHSSLMHMPLGSPRSEEALLNYLRISIPFNTSQMIKYAGSELGGKYLAWNLAYDLRATLLGYEKTKNPEFLRLFETAADKIIAIRDDNIGVTDNIRGRPAKAWGSNRYSDDKKQWVAWDAFTGMAAYPLARYSVIACSPERNVTNERCSLYQHVAEEALAEYSPYWVDDPASGGGYYTDPYLKDIAPLNHMNTLGLVHIELARLPNGKHHKLYAKKLAKYFKHHWKIKPDGTVEWEYWAGAKQTKNQSSTPEDVTHAQINLHFAYECYKAGIVFSSKDMKQLAKTLSTKIIRKNADWAADIGGSGNLISTGLHEGIAGWVILDEFDLNIRKQINTLVLAHPDAYPLGQFSYATGPIAVAHSIGRNVDSKNKSI